MVLSHDSLGCLPPHRAAGGPGPRREYYVLCGDQSVPATVAIIKLFVSEVPSTVNSQDLLGRTPLHHVVNGYSRYMSERSNTARFLCENGPDASL